ncbi:MAG: hypothetical protein ACYTFY_08500, partial [Planctomycetota bacterium]
GAFIAERSIDFMKKSKEEGKPFFTVASFQDPHAPFNSPEEAAEKYKVEDVDPPIGGEEDLATRPKHYQEHFHGKWDRGRNPNREAKYPGGVSEEVARERIAKTYAMIDVVDQNIGKMPRRTSGRLWSLGQGPVLL